jgi:hypothetical protein
MVQQLEMFKVPEEWIISQGKDITVGIVDGHIDTRSEVYKNVLKYYTTERDRFYGYEHCNTICELIMNFAPKCKLIVSQAVTDSNGNVGNLELAIKNIIKEKVDVINISLSTSINNEEMKNMITNVVSSGVIIVSSIANNGTNSYPAMYDGVLSVSSLKNHSYTADIYCDDSIYKGIKKTGNSMSTAFVSSLCALAKSYDRDITKETFLKRLLEK